MCGRCRFEGGPWKRKTCPWVVSVCEAPLPPQQIAFVAGDGSVHHALRAVVARQCAAVDNALAAGTGQAAFRLPSGIPASAVATALSFCQRVHNVAGREASIAIAWRKSFLPILGDDANLAALAWAARSLDARPLRQLACKAVADRILLAIENGESLTSRFVSPASSEFAMASDGAAAPGFDLCSAVGGVEALAECLAAGMAGERSRQVLLAAAQTVGHMDWRAATALLQKSSSTMQPNHDGWSEGATPPSKISLMPTSPSLALSDAHLSPTHHLASGTLSCVECDAS
jgi:hypothetical protein